jgi:hypothetical protein
VGAQRTDKQLVARWFVRGETIVDPDIAVVVPPEMPERIRESRDARPRVLTPAIDALVEIVRCMTGNDFAGEGRTLERLGLNRMDGRQIRRIVDKGFA